MGGKNLEDGLTRIASARNGEGILVPLKRGDFYGTGILKMDEDLEAGQIASACFGRTAIGDNP